MAHSLYMRGSSGMGVCDLLENVSKERGSSYGYLGQIRRFGAASGTWRRDQLGRNHACPARLSRQRRGLMIMGALAARVAAGDGGAGASGSGNIDSRTALHAIYTQPFGQILLWVVAVGLIGYALFDFSRALLDIEHEGTKPGALLKRISFAVVGIIYAGMAIAAIRLTLGSGSGKGSNASAQDWTPALDLPFGKFLVVLAGAIMIGFAAIDSSKHLPPHSSGSCELARMGERLRHWVVGCGRFGMAARAGSSLRSESFWLSRRFATTPEMRRGWAAPLPSWCGSHMVISCLASWRSASLPTGCTAWRKRATGVLLPPRS